MIQVEKFLKKYVFVLFSAILVSISTLFSCSHSSDNPSGSILYGSGGNTSELLIVTHKTWYDGSIGDTLKSVFGSTEPWFAQEEPTYELSLVTPGGFNDIYKKQRNIIIVVKNEVSKDATIEIKRDLWASPQIVVKFSIPNQESFAPLFSKYIPNILKLFHQNELNRINKSFGVTLQKSSMDLIQKKFGFSLKLPKGFVKALDTTDFLWLKMEKRDIDMGIFIYTYPFTDTSQFSVSSGISIRNEMTAKFVPGPNEYSVMKVSKIFPPYHQRTEFKGKYCSLLRSWWEIDKYPLGGPFLSYTFTDHDNTKMIVLDAYVLAPKKSKRDILIQLEAIFDTYTETNSASK